MSYIVSFNLCLTLSKNKQSRVISFRNIKNINLADLTTGIENLSIITPPYTPDQLVDLYNHGLKSLLNSLAPVKTRPVSFPHSAPWFSPHLRQLKAKGRQLERLFNSTGLTVHKQMHYAHILHYKDAISSAKSQYFLLVLGIPGPCSQWSTILSAPLISFHHTSTPLTTVTP